MADLWKELRGTVEMALTALFLTVFIVSIAVVLLLSKHTGSVECLGNNCWRTGPTHLELIIGQ